MNKLRIAFVLHTCDAYEFCWNGWFYYFKQFWASQYTKFDYPVDYFFVNETSAQFNKLSSYDDTLLHFHHLPTGKGEWAYRLKKALTFLDDYQLIIYVQEDMFFTDIVPIELFNNAIRAILLNKDLIRVGIYPRSKQDVYLRSKRLGELKNISKIESGYTLSHQISVWQRKAFIDLLLDGESPWDNELQGSKRMKNTPELWVGHLHCKSYYTGVVRKRIPTELFHALKEKDKW